MLHQNLVISEFTSIYPDFVPQESHRDRFKRAIDKVISVFWNKKNLVSYEFSDIFRYFFLHEAI